MQTVEEMKEQVSRLTAQIADAERQAQLAEDSKTVFIPLRTGDGKPVLREVTWGAAKVLLDQPLNSNAQTEGAAANPAASGNEKKKGRIRSFLTRKVI